MYIHVCLFICVCVVRAEPVLARIKEDHRRIILPSIDNIKHDTFEVERYENSGHGYNWELWCMYISPPKQWLDEGDTSAPIRQAHTLIFVSTFAYANTRLMSITNLQLIYSIAPSGVYLKHHNVLQKQLFMFKCLHWDSLGPNKEQTRR